MGRFAVGVGRDVQAGRIVTLSSAQRVALAWVARGQIVSVVSRDGSESIIVGPPVRTLRALERRKLVVGEAVSARHPREQRRIQWRLTDAGREANRE